MPKNKTKCIDSLRHNEFYNMQNVFDELYDKSKNNFEFHNLMDIILSENNILLAYRNIKVSGRGNVPGADGKTIKNIASMKPQDVIKQVRFILRGSRHGYRPKVVKQKEILKSNGETRTFGIPCIWDRLIQQCIKQVVEPVCEAKFSDNSYGFRPNRTAEHAIARTYRMLQMSNLHYVIETNIIRFFDNVNHSKLIKQIWSMGIHDKELVYILKRILKSPFKLQTDELKVENAGISQSGILAPLLTNIVLNELDHWIESQWQYSNVTNNYCQRPQKNGTVDRGHGYRAMRESTKLKEMWIVRYADEVRIFCSNRKDAENVNIGVQKWVKERLKLDISPEKTRIVNTRKRSLEFLGFNIKVHKKKKNSKYVVESHVNQNVLKDKSEKLANQVKKFCRYKDSDRGVKEVVIYNSMVIGIQNYYRIATNVAGDFNRMQNRNYRIMYNRLNTQDGTYTEHGREIIHDKLNINNKLLFQLMNQKVISGSIEYYDNKILLYSMQQGKCYVTGKKFEVLEEIHCHHKIAKSKGGADEYSNLILVDENVHRLIHAKKIETIEYYLELLQIKAMELRKINILRKLLELPIIVKNKKSLTLSYI